MIIYLCIELESNILIFSKDIEWKPFLLGMGQMDGRTDSGDTKHPSTENGGAQEQPYLELKGMTGGPGG